MPIFFQSRSLDGKSTGEAGPWGGPVLNPLMQAPGGAGPVAPGSRGFPLLQS